jgi:hypothetical protein
VVGIGGDDGIECTGDDGIVVVDSDGNVAYIVVASCFSLVTVASWIDSTVTLGLHNPKLGMVVPVAGGAAIPLYDCDDSGS